MNFSSSLNRIKDSGLYCAWEFYFRTNYSIKKINRFAFSNSYRNLNVESFKPSYNLICLCITLAIIVLIIESIYNKLF